MANGSLYVIRKYYGSIVYTSVIMGTNGSLSLQIKLFVHGCVLILRDWSAQYQCILMVTSGFFRVMMGPSFIGPSGYLMYIIYIDIDGSYKYLRNLFGTYGPYGYW